MRKLNIVVIFILFLCVGNLSAFDFQIDQAKVRIKLPPGWSDGGVILVSNRGKEPIKIRAYIEDWVYSAQDGSKNFMPAATHPNSCAEWIKFYPAEFTVSAKGTQKLNYVVAVPPDALGGHYAVLFFEVEAGNVMDNAKGIMVKVYNRLGSLFYVEVEGTIKRETQISDFKIQASSGNIEAEAIFQNSGNVDITARSTFDIIDQEGFVLARGNFNEVYTMAQDKAKVQAKGVGVNLPKGKYDVVLTIDLEEDVLVKEYQIEVSGSGRIVNIKETKEDTKENAMENALNTKAAPLTK